MNLPPRFTDSEINELVDMELDRIPTNCVREMFALIYTVPTERLYDDNGESYIAFKDDSVNWNYSSDAACWPEPLRHDSLDMFDSLSPPTVSDAGTTIDGVLVSV